MHPVNIRLHHFFVPNRILWDEWEDFITGGEDGFNASEIPTGVSQDDPHSIDAYLGVPPIDGTTVSLLPRNAYNMIFNEYYRDQDLTDKTTLGSLLTKEISEGVTPRYRRYSVKRDP